MFDMGGCCNVSYCLSTDIGRLLGGMPRDNNRSNNSKALVGEELHTWFPGKYLEAAPIAKELDRRAVRCMRETDKDASKMPLLD